MQNNNESNNLSNKSGKMNFLTIIAVGGAYASYQIGAGSASGQEALQYFVSYGSKWCLILPIFVAIAIAIYCYLMFRRCGNFENPNDGYEFYYGKYLGKVIDLFSIVLIGGIGLGLFSGCGASLKLYLGIPEYAGAIILGVVSVITALLGLEKLIDILGVCGVLIFGVMVIVAIATLLNPMVSLSETDAAIPQLLEEGTILRASVLGIENPIISTINYTGITLMTAFPFLVALSSRNKNKSEMIGSSITSGIFFSGTIYVGGVIILFTLPKLAEIGGLQVPNLAACKMMFPVLSYFVLAIIICAIYSTITGYLWIIGRRFAKDGTWKQRIIFLAVALIGIFTGSFVPFNQVVNFIFPIAGLVGIVMFIGIIIKEIQMAGSNKTEA